MSTHTITYGLSQKTYDVVRQERKSIKLTVTPEMNIVIVCPERVTTDEIETFLKRKWRWIQKQLNFFDKYQKKAYKKEYVSGESFFYLGKQYQLIIKKSDKDDISLTRDKLIVSTTQGATHKAYTKLLVDMWYKKKVNKIFKEQFEEILNRFGYKQTILLRIASMKRKWGSFKGSTVTLNPLLIQARKQAINYVITHELCHVKYKNHNKNFWNFMDTMYPGWEKEKEKLELNFS